jgi:hypothetical protein
MSGYIGNIPVPQATQTRDNFTATAGQTTFQTSGYTPSYLDVYLNGIHLDPSDYTATNGTDVVLASGASVGDVVTVVAYDTFTVADQAFSGDFSVDGSTFVVDSTNDNVGIGTSSPAQKFHVNGVSVLQAADNYLGNYPNGAYADIGHLATSEVYFDARSATLTNVPINIRSKGTGEIKFLNTSSELMRIDSSGRVTMPYQPAFCAYPDTSGTTQSAESILAYETALTNVGNHYNTSTYRFTAPVTGNYYFAFSAWTGSSTTTRAGFYKNGVRVGYSTFPIGTRHNANSNQNDSASMIINLTANDVVDVRVYAGETQIFGTNSFSGYLIG